MCLDEGTLQAYLDLQLEPDRYWSVETHLTSCLACRQRLERLREVEEAVGKVVNGYRQEMAGINPPVTRAMERFLASAVPDGIRGAYLSMDDYKSRDQKNTVKGKWQVFKRYKGVAAAAAVAVLLTAFLSFGPTRTLAANFLTVFRMEKIQVVSFTSDDLNQLEKTLRDAGLADLENLAQFRVDTETRIEEMSPEAAQQAVDFPVKVPTTLSGLALQGVVVQLGTSVTVTPQVDKINGVLQTLGSSQLLPTAIDGKPFTIKVPSAVIAEYSSSGSIPIQVIQAGLPSLTVPPGVDVEQIREALLQLPVLPGNLRRQLADINDWQNTLPIPDPNGEIREVKVNDANGVLISSYHNPEQITLIWQQQGVWVAVAGNLTLAEAREIAGQLR